jgi:hypothetical protein
MPTLSRDAAIHDAKRFIDKATKACPTRSKAASWRDGSFTVSKFHGLDQFVTASCDVLTAPHQTHDEKVPDCIHCGG